MKTIKIISIVLQIIPALIASVLGLLTFMEIHLGIALTAAEVLIICIIMLLFNIMER